MMPSALVSNGLILVLDTCGERASLALLRGSDLLEEKQLTERTASAALLGALRCMLAEHGATVRELAAIGVVSGPGSFTGVRVGLAMAKGLCEATGLPFAAVSRLRVLADAAGLTSGFALLPAGKGQVYVLEIGREGSRREWLTNVEQIRPLLRGRAVALTSPELAGLLGDTSSVHLIELSARHATSAILECLEQEESDLTLADANYVRNEEAIYRRALDAAEARTNS